MVGQTDTLRIRLWLFILALLAALGLIVAIERDIRAPPALAQDYGSLYDYPSHTSAPKAGPILRPKQLVAASNSTQMLTATLYTDIYNANFPYSVHIHDLDSDGKQELVLVGVLTDYSWIPTPNPRCSWCNEWRLNAYSWDGIGLTPKFTGTLDVGYDNWVRSAIGTLHGATKVVGVGNLYPCGSGEPHAGMAVFNASLQNEHYDWGARQSDPCHHDFSRFFSVDIADVDGDGTAEIVAGGAGDSTGGTNTYREWLLAIRTSDGAAFDEELYTHFDHGADPELLSDLTVADVDDDGTQEIVATGYSKDTGVRRTVLRIMTWDGTTLTTEHMTTFNIGDEDYLHRLAVADVDDDGKKEIVLAGWARTDTTNDWHVRVVRWDGSSLTPVADKTWSFGHDALIQAVTVSDVDGDGQAEILLAGDVNQEAVPGSSGGFGYIHYYADWYLKVMSLSGTSWTEEVALHWNSSRDYDTNDNGQPDSGDKGALGRLYDLAVGDLDGDGDMEVALVGEWVWVGWHVKVLTMAPVVPGTPIITGHTSRYKGTFLHGISLSNTYTVTINWNATITQPSTPKLVTFKLCYPQGTCTTKTCQAGEGDIVFSQEYNMGRDFRASPEVRHLEVVATNAQGTSSSAYYVMPNVIEPSAWWNPTQPVTSPRAIPPASSDNNSAEFEVGYKFPGDTVKATVDVPDSVPIIKGKWGVEWQPLVVGASFKSEGTGSVSLGGGIEVKAANRGGGVEVKAKGDLDENAKIKQLTGEVKGYLIFVFPKTPLPAPVSFISAEPRIKPSITGEFELRETKEGEEGIIAGVTWGDSQKLTLSAAVEAELTSTGVDFMKAGVGAEPSMTLIFKPFKVEKFGSTVYIWAEVGFGWFSQEYKITKPFYYPKQAGAMAAGPIALIEITDWHPMDRSYLGEDYAQFAANTVTGVSPLAVTGPTTETLIVANVFPRADPTLAMRGNEGILIWVHDDPTKPISQSLEIMASHWDGLSWSEPVSITTDAAVDLQPSVAYATDGQAVAAWVTISNSAAITDPHDIVGQMEIAYSTFNTATLTWEPPAKLTDNSHMDFLPQLAADPAGQLMALWLADPDNTFPVSRDEETPLSEDLYYAIWDGATWLTPTLALSGLATRDTPSFAPGDPLVAVWSAHTDDNPVTRADQEIYYTTWDGITWAAPQALTDDEFSDIEPHVLRDGSGAVNLAWVKEGITVTQDLTETTTVDRIYLATFDGGQWTTPTIAVEAAGITDLDLALDSRGDLVLIWQESSEKGMDMFYAIRDAEHGGLCSLPKQMTDDHPMDANFTAAVDGQDHIWASYLKHTIVTETLEVDIGEGNTVTVPVPFLAEADLYVLEHVIYNDAKCQATLSDPNPEPGSSVTISATVFNEGDLALEGLVVGFYDGIPELGGTLIATRTVEGGGQVGAAQLDNVLGAGRAATVSVEWAVPSEPVSHTLTVRVDPYDAIEEWDEDNDVQVVTVIPDLTVSEIYARYQPGQEDVLVKALISNTGALEALTTTVEFRQETVTGTLLSTVDLAPLAAGQSAVVTATWPISGVSGGWHYIYAIVDPADTVVELNEGNNTGRTVVKVLPDLALYPGDIDLGTNLYGGTAVTVGVRNEGVYGASGAVVGLYYSMPISGTVPLTWTTVDVPAGDLAVAGLNLTYPLPGFYIGVNVDREIEELYFSNNVALAGIGPYRVYMPVIMR